MSEVHSRSTNDDRELTTEQGLALAVCLGTLIWVGIIYVARWFLA